MTIKIEREAVLYVVGSGEPPSSSAAPSHPPSEETSYDDDAEMVVYSPKAEAPVLIPQRFRSWPVSCDEYSFDPSLSPCSTPSLVESDVDSDDDDMCSLDEPPRSRRRVTFAQPLITDVRTRPRTLPEDLRALFYTYEETQRFRHEYRLERKLLAQLDEDPASTPTSSSATGEEEMSWQGGRSRHRISRVVVKHHDTLETFYDDNLLSKSKQSPSSFGLPPLSVGAAAAPEEKSDDFFDNDSFWSGSITWY